MATPVLPTLLTPDSLLKYMRVQLGMKLSTTYELNFLVEQVGFLPHVPFTADVTAAAVAAGAPAADQVTLINVLTKKKGVK